MKSSKLLLSVIALAAFAAAPVLRAEDKPAPAAAGASEHNKGHQQGDRLKDLTEKLGLTDAQVSQIKPIIQDEMAAMKALREDKTSDKDAQKAKAMEIRKSHADQILAILTPDQQAKFKAGHEKRKEKGGDAPKPAN